MACCFIAQTIIERGTAANIGKYDSQFFSMLGHAQLVEYYDNYCVLHMFVFCARTIIMGCKLHRIMRQINHDGALSELPVFK